MAKGIEKELKYELTEKEYKKILQLRTKGSARHHFENIFFDTKSLKLNRSLIGVRIRIAGRVAYFTVKSKPPKTASIKGYTVRKETEVQIPIEKAKGIIRGDLSFSTLRNYSPWNHLASLCQISKLQIVPLGGLRTIRTMIKHQDLCLELDRCRLFNEDFFELEVETEAYQKAQAIIRRLFTRLGIEVRPHDQSKLGRFIESYKKR